MVPITGGDLGLPWRAPVRSPAVTQQEAVNALAAMLLGIALATLAAAAVTILILSVVRESERAGDVAVQRAVGASRRSLLGSGLFEGGMLALGGLVIGATAGWALASAARASWPGSVHAGSLTASVAAVLALAAVTITGATFPAAFPRRRIREAEAHAPTSLVPLAFQLGASLIALTLGGLMAQHAAGLTTAASANRSNDGAVFPITLPRTAPGDRAARYAEMLQELEAQGFDSVSLTSPGALVGLGPVSMVTTDCGRCSESGIWLPWRVKQATHQFVSADTFRLVGMKLLAGRAITAADTWNTPRVAVVSRSLAAREFQDGQAIGRRIEAGEGGRWSTVVGVVEDPSPVGLGGALQPRYTIYLSELQHPTTSAELLVRAPPGRSLGGEVLPVLQGALGRSAAATGWRSESSLLTVEAARLAWFGRWFGVEGWAMLGIAVVGAFGLVGRWVRSLFGELGIRRALGARRHHLFGRVLLRVAGVGLAGVAIGVWFGAPIWAGLPEILSGAAAWNGGVVARFATILVGSALAGALVPAWRAARLPPARLIAARGG